MRILGIDPGSRVCGYGVITVDGGRLGYVECGVLTAPEGWAMERRLGEIARHLTEVVAELAPDVVAVEDVFTHANPRSALALAQARGMALAVVGLAGLRGPCRTRRPWSRRPWSARAGPTRSRSRAWSRP